MSRPRLCRGCNGRPVAYKTKQFCFDCEPGGPHVPPPCRRCAATGNYFSAGLCRRCHQYAPLTVESCLDCLAFGVVRTNKWLCHACRNWRRHRVGECSSCHSRVALIDPGLCRLCWRTAEAQRETRGHTDALEANRHGQQLFFADMHRVAGARRTRQPERHTATPTASRKERQRSLFDPIPHPHATQLDQLARDRAAELGWSREHLKRVRTALKILTADHRDAEVAFSATDVAARLAGRNVNTAVFALLTEAGLVVEDRTPAIEAWFDRTVVGLPQPMTDELRVWFTVLHRGTTTSPRTRPRAPVTIRTRLRWAMPALRRWADEGHTSLREISRDDILAALPGSGTPRATVGVALRSIFRTLKAHKVVFVNPTARVRVDAIERNQPLPAELDTLREAVHSPDAARAALAALLVFHGLRVYELAGLHLTDLRDGRMRIGQRVIPVAEPARERVTVYLEQRNTRWPATANPHLFINRKNAITLAAVGRNWIYLTLGTAPSAFRRDRILEEARASGGDIRRLCDLFDISVNTAVRYVDSI